MLWFMARLVRFRWLLALRIARWVVMGFRDARGRLEPEERARLGELVRRPRRLTSSERGEVARLTLKAVGRVI